MKAKLKSIIVAYHMAVGHRVAAAMVCALCAVGLAAMADVAPEGTLCFTAEEDGSAVGMRVSPSSGWQIPTVEYRAEGSDWQTLGFNSSPTVPLNKGQKVWFRGTNPQGFSSNNYNYAQFKMTGKIAASGSVMSIIDPTLKTTAIPCGGCFNLLFCDCTSLTAAPELPATTLAARCYFNMFYGCTSLTNAPALPATTLADGCYDSMFEGCTSLTTAPELPATTLVEGCYFRMFCGCTSLTVAPELPVTTLAGSCYDGMFVDCTSLTTAPELPATTLAELCYRSMFNGCTSLTEAPALPATTLAESCYSYMFYGCTSLTEAPALPATTLAVECYTEMFYGCTNINQVSVGFSAWEPSSATDGWLENVAAEGTFVCPEALDVSTRDASHVPVGWIVERVVFVTLPTDVPGCTYAVSNLTADAEIPATKGNKYALPSGAKVGIYAVPEEGYVVTGTNPYVIEKVTEGAFDASKLPKAVKLVVVTLPTEVPGCTYVVSNLTEDVEIEPTEAGGSDYILPHGKTVGIYAVPSEGYVVTGTNPYVIDEVTAETTLDTTKLPKAERELTVANVTTATHWPWDGKIDITCDLTGAGKVRLGAALMANGVKVCEAKTANLTGATVDLDAAQGETNGVQFVWNAKADCPAGFNAADATVVVTAKKVVVPSVQLWENGPYIAEYNVGAESPEEFGWYFWWGDTVGYKRNANNNGWVSVADGTTTIMFSDTDTTANQTCGKTFSQLQEAGFSDDASTGVLNAAHDAATAHLGAPWRMMTYDELQQLVSTDYCESKWVTEYKGVTVSGYVVKGKAGSAYANNEVFFPAARYGADSKLSTDGHLYWSSTPTSHSKEQARNLAFKSDSFSPYYHYRYLSTPVRAVRDTPTPPQAPSASAESAAFAYDAREKIALAEGSVTIPNVTWSATQWGKVPETDTTVGWKSLTTGETGAFGNLSNMSGQGAADVELPKENGDYMLTHSTGDLTSFATFTVSGYPVIKIPAVQGCRYVVTDLTTGAEIKPTEGDKYALPVRKKVAITCVPDDGYEVVGKNPYVIESVPAGMTAIDANKLPTVVREGTLCFTAEATGVQVEMFVNNPRSWNRTPPTVEYLIEGEGWKTVEFEKFVPLGGLKKGQKVWFRGNNPQGFSLSFTQYVGFFFSNFVAASGSVMSLIDPTLQTTSIPCDYCFCRLFDSCRALTAAPELPATELKSGCYKRMFYDCSYLKQVCVGFSAWEPADATEDWLKGVAEKGTFVRLAPLEIDQYGASTVPVGWAVVPWYVGASDPTDAIAWFDEDLKAVVIDNGMPKEKNAIGLVSLTKEMTKFGYEPAELLTNVFVKVSDGGEDVFSRPVAWFDADNTWNSYPTLVEALEAGVTAVLPSFDESSGCTLLIPALIWAELVAPPEIKEELMFLIVARNVAHALAHDGTFEQFFSWNPGETFSYSKEGLIELLAGEALSLGGYMLISDLTGAADLKKLTSGLKPIGWLDANDPTGEPYATLEDALKAGVRSVIPVFATDPVSTATGAVTYPKVSSGEFLKEKSTATWKAKAGDACVFAGWTWPKGEVASAAFAALSENELKNPTLKIKVAEGEQVRPEDIAATWAWIDEDVIGEVELTATGLAVESRSYVTATVSGLPSGLKFDAKTLAITGTATKNETKTVKVTVKNASGFTVKQNFEMKVAHGEVVSIVAEDPVRTGSPVIVVGDVSLGKVKGSKVYVAGKKASLKATPAKGSVFLGWYEDPDFKTPATWLPKGYETASQSVVVPEEGLALYARFVRLEDWAVGNFTGDYYENGEKAGTAKLTVGSTGKVSGKVTVGGKSRSFSAKSFDDSLETDGHAVLVAHPTMKVNGATVTLRLLVGPDEADITFGEGDDAPYATLRRDK